MRSGWIVDSCLDGVVLNNCFVVGSKLGVYLVVQLTTLNMVKNRAKRLIQINSKLKYEEYRVYLYSAHLLFYLVRLSIIIYLCQHGKQPNFSYSILKG